MKMTIYRGTKEIGGTLIELATASTRILIDAGYPLFLKNEPIKDDVAKLPKEQLLELGVLPNIHGLYSWDEPGFDAIIVSHAHIDHYGLLKYVHPDIPVYMSDGTRSLIEVSQRFKIVDTYPLNTVQFRMYESFAIGDMCCTPYLIDHSAFDAAAFEIRVEGKTVIYTGDFRGHGRKAVCFDRFIDHAKKCADLLLSEGTMLGRQDEAVLTEDELELKAADIIRSKKAPVLIQSSSQNIDRIVSFFRAAQRCRKTFVVDVYTANVLYELRQLGNSLPYPSPEFRNIKVFYPYRLTQKIFNEIGEEYAKRFSAQHISKAQIKQNQNNIVMMVRPSMRKDIENCGLRDGTFIYSLWQGYRQSEYQQQFENALVSAGFELKELHTSGHASVSDIKRLIDSLQPKKVVPIHTMTPDEFSSLSDCVEQKEDGATFKI